MIKKILIIFLFIIFAIPIPVAVIGGVFAIVWVLGALLIPKFAFLEVIITCLTLVIGGMYLFTYIFALKKTWEENKISAKTFLPLAHCIMFLLFFSLVQKPVLNYVDYTTPHFGFEKRDFEVVEELDTHGGFQGDGSYYLTLDCSDNKEKAMKIIENWNELPLSENLNIAMYGGEKDGVSYGFELAEKAHIPQIKNGYYIFEDRHFESNDSESDAELLDRSSFNFSIGIYDCDTDKMYYFEFDT